jgi:hypothetical protein
LTGPASLVALRGCGCGAKRSLLGADSGGEARRATDNLRGSGLGLRAAAVANAANAAIDAKAAITIRDRVDMA